jgi:hypothetical protein
MFFRSTFGFEVGLPANHVTHCALGPAKWLLCVSSSDDKNLVGLVVTPQLVLQTFVLSLDSALLSLAAYADLELGRGAVVWRQRGRTLVRVRFQFESGDGLVHLASREMYNQVRGYVEASSRMIVCKCSAKWTWLEADTNVLATCEHDEPVCDVFRYDPAAVSVLRQLSTEQLL